MDFYTMTSQRLPSLSAAEKTIFNYVIKNLHVVKDMSIRDLSSKCYVSTATMFRFVKKLGFEGYSDFILAIKETEQESRHIHIPNIMLSEKYSDSYLKNIIEAVKIITDDKIEKFNQIMSRFPKIYILAEGFSEDIAKYFYRMLKVLDYDVEIPKEQYEINSLLKRIKKDDVLLILSYKGNNSKIIHQIEQIFAVATPTIISITRADNNVVQNMSDLNFYVFADEIDYNGIDVTSRAGMLAVMEILLFNKLAKE